MESLQKFMEKNKMARYALYAIIVTKIYGIYDK